MGSREVMVWCSENGSLWMGKAMRFKDVRSAEVLLIVRRWWGITSSLSESARSSRSDIGMSSSSESSSEFS